MPGMKKPAKKATKSKPMRKSKMAKKKPAKRPKRSNDLTNLPSG